MQQIKGGFNYVISKIYCTIPGLLLWSCYAPANWDVYDKGNYPSFAPYNNQGKVQHGPAYFELIASYLPLSFNYHRAYRKCINDPHIL
jgi:hypothetical protein